MDTSEKVKIFNSFGELTQEIIRDRDTRDMLAQRYAVRFIMLNNFNEFKELAKFMTNIGVDTLDLENLIDEGEDDTWITKDTLKNAIKACKTSSFITPFSEVVRFYNDDDFSNTYIIKVKFEARDNKSIYAAYVLTKQDFTVDCISSSAIHLGLSMDLLKKYVINIQNLVRNEINLEDLSLIEQYPEYEEESRKVSWVYPHKIYPKDENERNNEETVEELKQILGNDNVKIVE
jgi:hypothetical protein